MLIVASLCFILLILEQVSKFSGSCNNIDDPYVKLYLPDVVKNINIKVFNIMSTINETRQVKWHDTCKCKCRLDACVCNSQQRWNKDKCRCECNELIEKGIRDKRFIWNPSNCKRECHELCDVGEYLDNENFKCRKRLIDKLIKKCTENIDEVKIAEMALLERGIECKSSRTIYVVLIAIVFPISIGIGTSFINYKYMNHDKKTATKYDYVYQTSNY